MLRVQLIVVCMRKMCLNVFFQLAPHVLSCSHTATTVAVPSQSEGEGEQCCWIKQHGGTASVSGTNKLLNVSAIYCDELLAASCSLL